MTEDIDELKETLGDRFEELEKEGEIETAREAVKTIKSLEQAENGETLSDESDIRKRINEIREEDDTE